VNIRTHSGALAGAHDCELPDSGHSPGVAFLRASIRFSAIVRGSEGFVHCRCRGISCLNHGVAVDAMLGRTPRRQYRERIEFGAHKLGYDSAPRGRMRSATARVRRP